MIVPGCCEDARKSDYISWVDPALGLDVEGGKPGYGVRLLLAGEPYYILIRYCPFCGTKLPVEKPDES